MIQTEVRHYINGVAICTNGTKPSDQDNIDANHPCTKDKPPVDYARYFNALDQLSKSFTRPQRLFHQTNFDDLVQVKAMVMANLKTCLQQCLACDPYADTIVHNIAIRIEQHFGVAVSQFKTKDLQLDEEESPDMSFAEVIKSVRESLNNESVELKQKQLAIHMLVLVDLVYKEMVDRIAFKFEEEKQL
jgi:hypothetical protein